MLGGRWDLHKELVRAMTRGVLLGGNVYVVRDRGSRRIVSVGFWLEPGQSIFGSEEQRALGFNTFFRKLSPDAQYWWNNTYPDTMRELRETVWTGDEMKRRWWCSHLATHPEQQGRGFATAIVDYAYDDSVAMGQFLGLATQQELNVRKYEAMGFRERGRTLMPAPTGDFPVIVLSKT
ncbi:hypothetical protein OE88DRAFT_1735760 [Heliocybe sulcata]|uniref:N-acetyltransferase domain-containing protein n=1 Tax=Heliocybe sulcata TaxID=5364 RepID=A0A5C3N1H7_9AGAM|nr:hypothetical protein OE88DRAFT_1735760 [Heliocybe sulcata]